VCARQVPGTLRVKDRDVERLKALTGYAGSDIGGDVSRAGELSQPLLRRDLPRRRGADENRIGRIRHGSSSLHRQSPIAVQPPE
jgi:hypothetical protein